jgi:hypothetical protein
MYNAQPIQFSHAVKKQLSPSQRKQENSLNQKTSRPHKPNMGWENSSVTRPYKEQKRKTEAGMV